MPGSQMEMDFSKKEEVTKTPIENAEAEVAEARMKYGIADRQLVKQGDVWYTNDFDGTFIPVEEWKKKTSEIYEPEEGSRKDLN